MLAIMRFRVDPAGSETVEAQLTAVVAALAVCPGFVDATIGRGVDDVTLWSVVTRWADLGTYRRSLSAYDVKVAFGSVQRWMLDEPSAFDTIAVSGRPSAP